MRALWDGRNVNHHGRHYTVESARLHSLPDRPPPVIVSALGPKAVRVAARAGDGTAICACPAPTRRCMRVRTG